MSDAPDMIPVIDLFAGPGGLSEGFSRYRAFTRDRIGYRVQLSIEKEEAAAKTLRLRAFFRHFTDGDAPAEYYSYIQSADPSEKKELLEKISSSKAWRRAAVDVWKTTLGAPGVKQFFKLHRRIKQRVSGAEYWVLLGGPPCQAYSTVGRARRLGDGRDLRRDLSTDEIEERRRERAARFFEDDKHTLYREYLRIVALHQPPIFVMENVKGILSSKNPRGTGSSLIFDQILKDLRDPWAAISDHDLPDGWQDVASGARRGYELYSFTTAPSPLTGDCLAEEYIIHAERHGVPQERHRVILLGVRDDLDAVPQPLKPHTRRSTVRDVIGGLPRLRSGRSGRLDTKSRERRADSLELWIEAIKRSMTAGTLDAVEPPEVRECITQSLNQIALSILDRGKPFIPADLPSTPDLELDRWLRDDKLGGVIQHQTRDHMDADFARYLFAAAFGQVTGASPKIRHFPPALLPHHESIRDAQGQPTGSKIFHDRFRVQVAGKPSATIMAHIRKDGHYYIHFDPCQCRSLTVREAARLQTFPDNYYFEGNRTEQYEQVGNAVPPYLAVQLAGVVADVFKQIASSRAQRKKRKAEDLARA